ncbi:hypothetical protein [Prosthecobacter sp.]|uniref:hypothetical protein n=1 Tax=Prosthecobacter sp. TaxID=1965333 RepID=UPI003783F382
MNLLADSSQLSGWQVLLTVAVIVFLKWLAIGCHKAEIRAEIRKKGAKPLHIRWLPSVAGSRGGPSFYEVTLSLPSGSRMTTECSCDLTNGVFWKDAPWSKNTTRTTETETGLPDTRGLRIVADCTRCGFGIPKGADACPNCGTEMNSAER